MPPRDIGLRRGRALQLARGVRGQTGREALAVGPLARLGAAREVLGDEDFGEGAREGGGREEAAEAAEEHEGGERERGESREEHRGGVRVGKGEAGRGGGR